VKTKAGGDEAVTLAVETSRHSGKLVKMANPDKGNKIAMTIAQKIVATRIMHPATVMTKGKAPPP
jgi:hypothetical protein